MVSSVGDKHAAEDKHVGGDKNASGDMLRIKTKIPGELLSIIPWRPWRWD